MTSPGYSAPAERLTDAECKKLILATCAGGSDEGATETDAMKVVHWATQVRADNALLSLLLKGILKVKVVGDEFIYTSA